MNAFDFTFKNINGDDLPLSNFRGKVLLVVNTASECGFTGQYEGLENLYKEYGPRGLVVIGVPCNDFGKQEPGTEADIKNFCETRFHVTFPMTGKTTVSGDEAHPFYKWAGEVLGFGTKPKWNFHKYLIDKNGNLVDHFNSTTNPTAERVKEAIEKLL